MAVLSKLQAAIDTRVLDAIQLDAPTWFLHPFHKAVFGDLDVFEETCNATPLTFAEGLFEILHSPTPPSIEYFKSLPAVVPKEWSNHWVVYIHIYEMEGRRPRIYIGSATRAIGAACRLREHNNPDSGALPRFVKAALAQGFTKTHTALLCWSKKPVPGLQPKARLRYLGIEGVFQMLFFASIFNKYEPEWVDSTPWCREDVEWLPLCSHISFNESCVRAEDANQLGLSFEALEEVAAGRAEHRKLKQRRKDQVYRANHREAIKVRHSAGRQARKASGKYYCTPCKKVFSDSTKLKLHLGKGYHKKRVAKIANGESLEPSARQRRTAKLFARVVEEKRHYCDICEKAFQRDSALRKHFGTKIHIKNATDADAALVAIDDTDDSAAESDCEDVEDLEGRFSDTDDGDSSMDMEG